MHEIETTLSRAAAGDEAAWRDIVNGYQRLVFATIRGFRIPPDDAQDIFQETFLRLHRHALRLRDSRALTRWIIVTTRHLCLDHLARTRNLERLVPDTEPAPEDLSEDHFLRLERAQRIREALAQIAPRCRELLRILYFEQEKPDYRQAAARLGIPVGSVGPTRARCFEHLLRKLRGSGNLEGGRP